MDFSFLNDASSLMDNYGPIAVLILLILPLMGEDVIIIPAGFLIGQGHLGWWATFWCAYIGAFISDGMWYWICSRFGTPLLHKRWFKRLAHPRRLLQAKHQIERRGAWLIVTARFVPGSRTSAMIMAGLLHMPWWKFVLAEGTCLLITVPMQLGLGWLISHQIGSQDTVGTLLTMLGVIVALIVGAFLWSKLVQHRKSNLRAPRSKAKWLRHFRPKSSALSHRMPLRKRAAAGKLPIA